MMKFITLLALLSLSNATVVAKDRTITQVVKLLQGMLDQSVKEGDQERKIFAKFKCYCDQSTAEKTDSIKALTEQIALLESTIEKIQGETGELSSDCAELKASMADNEAAQDEATTIRDKENKAFKAEKADLEQGIDQMKRAIATLSAVGADQTKSTGADNKQFMAGHKGSLLSVQSEVQSALRAAAGLMTPAQRTSSESFLQAPFTGTYASQSAQVLGIIKSMRDTFVKNLEDATTTESNSLKSYDAFMKVKKAAFASMKTSFEAKQKDLGSNDKELATQKSQLAEATKQKASDEEFMSKLTPMCEEKTTDYGNRKVLRANEEAAIAEAISILNSDDAFATFAGNDATKTGATGSRGALRFIQLRSVQSHVQGNEVKQVLEVAAKATKSTRLAKVLVSLRENVFSEVLTEIDNMVEVIAEEGKADKKKFNWCANERKDQTATRDLKRKQIIGLDKDINKLDASINDKKSGMLVQIQEAEKTLDENDSSQTSETTERTEENVAYQADVSNLVKAESILTKALKVLETYYAELEKKLAAGEAGLLQKSSEDPKAPTTDFNSEGQSKQGGDVIGMLTFILTETQKEESTAHADEEKAQASYEDSMTALKKEQAETETTLSNLQEKLAKAQADLLSTKEDKKNTIADKEAAKAVLARIKPGCDFIKSNFKTRNANRKTETDALNKAVSLIKATPAYKTAMNAAKVDSYGDCKAPCTKDAAHAECKACMADVTIPAFCAGHKGTKGC